MAVYTHDGIRHNNIDEAKNYLAETFISEVPPFDDEYYLALHNTGWGKYEFQSIPDGITNDLYLELMRYHENGFSMLKFSDAHPPEEVESTIQYLQKETKMMDVVHSEIQSYVAKWSEDGNHIFINDVEDDVPVQLEFNVQALENGLYTIVNYTIDEAFTGEVVITADNNRSVLELVLEDVESHLLLEASGDYDVVTGKIDNIKIENMLGAASVYNYGVTISINTKKEQSQEEA